MDAPTLQQLEVFLAVVEAGSFSAAARRLGRAQSAVSHAVATLEGELGVALFEREGRRPTLTDPGRVLLQDARAVTAQVERLVGRAVSLRRRVEAELCLVVDVLYPHDRLVDALRAMHDAHPEVAVRLRSETLGAVVDAVRAGEADLGVCPAVDAEDDDLDLQPLAPVALVPAVAAGHPLAAGRQITAEHLANHVQIVLSSRAGTGPDRGVRSPRVWRVGDLPTRIALVRAGFGWANLPAHAVQAELEAGALVELDLAAHRAPWQLPMVAIAHRARPPGPAGRVLAAALR